MTSNMNSIWSTINNKPRLKRYAKLKAPIKVGFFGFKAVRLNNERSIRNISRKNLTWSQASIRYPKMNPFGDADRDGKLNMFDCKPFNRKKHGEFIEPPEEYMTGEIMDPYYDEYLQNQEDIKKKNAEIQAQQIPLPKQPINIVAAVAKKIPPPQKWARPGIYNEYDYLEAENAIDEYVGSGSGSAIPVRGFNPTGGGNKYG